MKRRDDLDLEHFRARLLEERERLLKELESVEGEIEALDASAEGIEDPMDAATLEVQNDIDQSQIRRIRQELEEVEHALEKVRDGSYGICEKTGRPIPVERLEAYPAARTVAEV